MAPQGHQADRHHRLAKIGKEGFDIVDEFFGQQKKAGSGGRLPYPQEHPHLHHPYHYNNNYNYQYDQQPYIYRGPQILTVRQPVMDSNEAAKYYGGMLIVEHGIRKPIHNGF